MERIKGILWAALSSATFGLVPLFTLLLLGEGFSLFDVLVYRYAVSAVCMGALGLLIGCSFRLSVKQLATILWLSALCAATALSLVVAYQNIASGVASTIHFMYPLAVALAMIGFFGERGSVWIFTAIGLSIVGAVLLSTGNVDLTRGNIALGFGAAVLSVFTYGGYIIGMRRTCAAQIDATVLTACVMAFCALFFLAGGCMTEGIRFETRGIVWLYILGLALPATAISNLALVRAVKSIGPTLTAVFGALEPLTAVVIGVLFFAEPFTLQGGAGIALIVAAVTVVVLRSGHK